jgi:hypothetical protein
MLLLRMLAGTIAVIPIASLSSPRASRRSVRLFC